MATRCKMGLITPSGTCDDRILGRVYRGGEPPDDHARPRYGAHPTHRCDGTRTTSRARGDRDCDRWLLLGRPGCVRSRGFTRSFATCLYGTAMDRGRLP